MTVTELEPEIDATEGLTDVARAAIWDAWGTRVGQRARLERCRDYANGRGGIVALEEGASDELENLAKVSRLNMCGVAVKTFKRGLSVVGYRSPTAEDDEPAWEWWQKHRLDARQQQVYGHALTYSEGYVSVLPDDRVNDKARPVIWSPLSAVVEYDEPDDLFPTSALLIRRTAQGWSVLAVNDKTVTPGILRAKSKGTSDDRKTLDGVRIEDIEITGEPWDHGAVYEGRPVCPVVKFTDESSDEDVTGRGVVEPMIDLARAMNIVNFNRLVVSQYGAHDQKLIIGWTDTKDRLIKLNAAHIGAIDEDPENVRIDRWQASPLSPYNELVKELREQFALEAAIPLWAAGNISNVSTDTAAMIEAAHQRELVIKRESYGESWELVLALAIQMSGLPAPSESAEMVWRETQARAFAAVVDGIVKLASIPADAQGVPIEDMLDMIPGMTQQKINAIADAIRRRRSQMAFAAVAAATRTPADAPAPAEDPTTDAAAIKAQADALGALVRAGVEPEGAARRVGLEGIEFTGAVPVSLRQPEALAGQLEEA
jgi:hypothetical protein